MGKSIEALAGVTTADSIEVKESKVGGVDSVGMFCGPVQMGWSTDLLDKELAVILDPGSELGKLPEYEDAIKAFREREKAAAAKAEPKGKKGKKKPNKEDDEDLDAVLAEFGTDKPAEEKPKENG